MMKKKGTYMEAAYTVPMTLRTLALHRVLDGNLWLQRLRCRYPPVSPTSGIPYAGSSHNRDEWNHANAP